MLPRSPVLRPASLHCWDEGGPPGDATGGVELQAGPVHVDELREGEGGRERERERERGREGERASDCERHGERSGR